MSLMKFFTIREVPTTRWSSEYPLNIKPRIETLFMVFVGNIIFGFGVAVIIAAGAGLDPWTILAEGLGLIFDVKHWICDIHCKRFSLIALDTTSSNARIWDNYKHDCGSLYD